MAKISANEACSYIAGWAVSHGLLEATDRNYAYNRIYSYVSPTHSDSADDLVLPKHFSIGDALHIIYKDVEARLGESTPCLDVFIQELFASFLPTPSFYAKHFEALVTQAKGSLVPAFWWLYAQQQAAFALAASEWELGLCEPTLDDPDSIKKLASPDIFGPLYQGSSSHVPNLRYVAFDFAGTRLNVAFAPRPYAPFSFSLFFGLQTPDQKAQKVKSAGLIYLMLELIDALSSDSQGSQHIVLISSAHTLSALSASDALISGFMLPDGAFKEELFARAMHTAEKVEIQKIGEDALCNKTLILTKEVDNYIFLAL